MKEKDYDVLTDCQEQEAGLFAERKVKWHNRLMFLLRKLNEWHAMGIAAQQLKVKIWLLNLMMKYR